MKENKELQRVNYSNAKHHRQIIREQIDPTLITDIEVSPQPSLNYKNAFKNVYMDELQKSLQYQQQKKHHYHDLSTNRTSPFLPTFTPSTNHSLYKSRPFRPQFADYDEQRHQKFDDLINKGYDGGNGFFKSQDQYLVRKQEMRDATRNFLEEQLLNKDMKKMKENQEAAMVAEEIRLNRTRQLQMDLQNRSRVLEEQRNERTILQGMIERERIARHRKSNCKVGQASRHNPITNPIEYHIDNPYILYQIQQKHQH